MYHSNEVCQGASSGAWQHWVACHILHLWWPLHIGWLALLQRDVVHMLIYALVEVVGKGVLVLLVASLLA